MFTYTFITNGGKDIELIHNPIDLILKKVFIDQLLMTIYSIIKNFQEFLSSYQVLSIFKLLLEKWQQLISAILFLLKK